MVWGTSLSSLQLHLSLAAMETHKGTWCFKVNPFKLLSCVTLLNRCASWQPAAMEIWAVRRHLHVSVTRKCFGGWENTIKKLFQSIFLVFFSSFVFFFRDVVFTCYLYAWVCYGFTLQHFKPQFIHQTHVGAVNFFTLLQKKCLETEVSALPLFSPLA